MLLDISLLNPPLRPGPYTLQAAYEFALGSPKSDPVHVTLVALSESDAQEAARLRGENPPRGPSWGDFVRLNAGPIDPSRLSATTRHAIAMHLFLQRVAHGPQSIPEIDPEAVTAFAKGPLEGEAAILRYEVLRARAGGPLPEEEQRLLAKWPGLKWRTAEIEEGWGLLSRLRGWWGAERGN